MARYDVFISYSRSDLTYKDGLTHALRENGLKIFADNETIMVGESFASQIKDVIENSAVVVVLWGEHSIDSLWNRREIEFAQSLNKQIIVVPLATDRDVPSFLLNYEQTLLTPQNKVIENVVQLLNKKEYLERAHLESSSIGSPRASCEKAYSKFNIGSGSLAMVIVVILIGCLLLFNWRSHEVSPNEVNSPMQDVYPCDEWNMADTIMADTVATDIPDMSQPAYDSAIVVISDESTVIEDTIASVTFSGNPDQPVIYGVKTSPEGVTEKSSWNFWFIGLLFFCIGCVTTLTVARIRRKNVKISSDVDVSVSIDSKHKSELKAGQVFISKLDKGEYIVECQPKSKDYKCTRIIHHVSNSEPQVIYTRFLEDSSKTAPAKTIKCFIAGSTSLQTERDALRSVIVQMYNQWESMNFRIMSYTFEDFSRSVVIGGHQKLYDKFIEEDADWVFFIIADGVGDKTLHEYKLSLDSFKNSGHPKIICFAKDGVSVDPNVVSMKKMQFQEDLYWYPYSDLENLKLKFSQTLSWDLALLYRLSNNQRKIDK